MMKHIQQLIVVEGKNDTARLKQFFDCDTIETGGSRVDKATLDRIEAAAATRGVIVFTDPDSPGEFIRRRIGERHIPGISHVFIEKKKARTDKKVGVEHASQKDLEEALSHAVIFDERRESLSHADYLDFGLVGDAPKRHYVCQAFRIGPCNGKTCFKRLNQMGITKEQIEEVLHGYTNRD